MAKPKGPGTLRSGWQKWRARRMVRRKTRIHGIKDSLGIVNHRLRGICSEMPSLETILPKPLLPENFPKKPPKPTGDALVHHLGNMSALTDILRENLNEPGNSISQLLASLEKKNAELHKLEDDKKGARTAGMLGVAGMGRIRAVEKELSASDKIIVLKAGIENTRKHITTHEHVAPLIAEINAFNERVRSAIK